MEVDVESGRNARVAQLVKGLEEQTVEFVQSNPLHNAARCGNIIKIRRLIVTENYPVDHLDPIGNTPLLASFSNSATNRLDIVQTLFNLGADVNAKTRNGSLTPLQLCCSTKPPDFLQVTDYLINAGADVYVKGKAFKRNLIHMASLRFNALEYHHYLLLLIEKGYNDLLFEVDFQGNTPLHMATRLELNKDTLQVFYDHGTDFNVRNFRGNTVLDESVINKKSQNFLETLLMFGALPGAAIPTEPSTLPPLDVKWWSVRLNKALEKIEENSNAAETEIEQLKKEWKSWDQRRGNTLLHASAIYRNFKLAKLLLTMGFDVNAVNYNGSTPLQLCFENYSEGTLEVIKVLLNHGADVETYKHSCFQLCTTRKISDWKIIFHCLLQHTNDVDGAMNIAQDNLSHIKFVELERYLEDKCREEKKRSSSSPAKTKVPIVKGNSVSIDWKAEFSKVIFKIKRNAQLTQDLVDKLNSEWVRNCTTGNSLLHAAAYFRNAELAKILLTMGYDANFVGNHGYTPLQSCLENNSENALEITQMLLEQRAEVDLKPVYKHSSFHLCTLRKPPDWIPVFYYLLQLSNDKDGAMEVASSNLSFEEFNELHKYLQLHQNNSSNGVDSSHPNDDGILELALQLEEKTALVSLQCDTNNMTSVEESGDCEMLSVESEATGENVTHEATEEEESHSQPFQCSQCQNRFETSLKQQLHTMQKHDGEKMFQCHVCSHKVKTAQGYEIHLRTHTQEKPFLCHQCGKRFMAHSGLRKHLTSHTGTRPFACTQCQKTFALKSILKDHIKTHTELSTPFGCNQCEKRFRFKKGLTRHQRKHFDNQKYCCEVCNRMFDRKDNLTRHYNRLHSST